MGVGINCLETRGSSKVPKVENPTEEQIDEVHQKIIAATKQMFDLHKASLGWGDKEMKFV